MQHLLFINYFRECFDGASSAELWAHIISLAALVLALFVFLLKKRTHIIAAKSATDALYSIHFILLGQFTGAAVTAVNFARGIVFGNKEKKWAAHLFWCPLFILLTLAAAALTWRGAISLLPAVGSSLAVIGMWQSDIFRLRILNLSGILLWLIYSALIFSPSALICNLLYALTLIYSLIRDAIRRKKSI